MGGLDFNNIFNNFDPIDFLLNPPFPEYFLVMKIVFILIFLYFLLAIIFNLKNTHYLQWYYGESFSEFMSKRPYGTKKMDVVWSDITKRLDTGIEADYKLAIMEADEVLETVLKKVGYSGKTLGEMLESLTYVQLLNVHEIKTVHKTRGDIIRDPNYMLSLGEAKKLLKIYHKALVDLEAF